ncbi:hypothetical protein CRENBAI_016648 [Crenichthys baileyi]|uniref:Uncharacterized protein n=1 Tax=Crenichthys baileyi TaxID=28760 RepID=A0AAV9RXT9_9TELE
MDLADDHQASSIDLFTFLSREPEKTLHRSAGLSVPQSAYDGSRLAIPCPGTGPLRRRSSPPLHTAVKPSSSSHRKKRRRGAPSCVSASEEESPTAAAATPGAVTPLLAGGGNKPASSSATALSPRLAAAPPMPSSLAPAWCSEATPDELEQRLRFFARQIKSFRRTSLMYSSPELVERIRQMEGDYETAVRQFYCRPPSTPGLLLLQSSPRQGAAAAAAAAEQPTPGSCCCCCCCCRAAHAGELLLLLQSSPRRGAAAAEQPTSGSCCCCCRAAHARFSERCSRAAHARSPERCRVSGGASGLPQRPGPEHLLGFLLGVLMELRPDSPQPEMTPDTKSAPTSSTRRRGRRKRDASAQVIGGPGDASASVHTTESFVLVLASEPRDEGFARCHFGL